MPTFDQFQSRKFFSLLDGMRALAILAVLWHHSNGENPLPWSIFTRGYLGVDLFFVISGFLITHLLIKEKRITGSISLRNFYVRRTLRIFPLYYGYLFGILVLAAISQPQKVDRMLDTAPFYLLYISNWIPEGYFEYFHRAWSLAVEEQFYLLWPVAVVLLGIVRSTYLVLTLMLASFFCLLGFVGQTAFDINQLLVPYRTIFLGCLVAIILNQRVGYEFFVRHCNGQYFALGIMLILILFVSQQAGDIVGLAQLTVHLLMAAFLIGCVINEQNALHGFLRLRLLQIIGVTSYGIYILHSQFWGVTHKLLSLVPGVELEQSRFFFFLLFTLFATVAGFISFHTYEKFFLGFKKRFEVGAPVKKKAVFNTKTAMLRR